MDPSDVGGLGLDLQVIARLQQDLDRPTPSELRNLITMTLLVAFWEGLDRKRILDATPNRSSDGEESSGEA